MSQIEIEAPATGTVWKLECQAGERVGEGSVLLVLESMKMEIPVEAPVEGTLLRMNVAEGDAVSEGDVLCVVQP